MGSLAGRTQVFSCSPIPIPDTPVLCPQAAPYFSRKFRETFSKVFQNSRHGISLLTISINST